MSSSDVVHETSVEMYVNSPDMHNIIWRWIQSDESFHLGEIDVVGRSVTVRSKVNCIILVFRILSSNDIIRCQRVRNDAMQAPIPPNSVVMLAMANRAR
jgi:hypothetical protein